MVIFFFLVALSIAHVSQIQKHQEIILGKAIEGLSFSVEAIKTWGCREEKYTGETPKRRLVTNSLNSDEYH